jgi:hypothetical protein
VLKDAAAPLGGAQDPAWRSGEYGAALSAGFQVGWERSSSGQCGRCEQGRGKCAYNRAGGDFIGCICADGAVDGGGCSKIVVSDSDSVPGTYVLACRSER